jgi:hypothetical protein
VTVAGDGVLYEPVGKEVEELPPGSEAAGSSQIQMVVDLAVGGLSVAAPPHEAFVVGVTGWD